MKQQEDEMDTQSHKGPDIVEALRTVAMLVRVRVRAPGEIRIDRKTTLEIEHAKGAETGTVATQVKRFKAAKEWDGAIRKHQRDAKKEVEHRTLPWGEDENRCLPTENFMDLVRDFDKHQKEVDRLAGEIAERADAVADMCNRSLGDLEVEPVTADTFRGTYALTVEFHEIPQGHFKGVPKQAQEWLQREYARKAEGRFKEGLMLGLKRLIKPMSNLVERIDIYDKRNPNDKTNADTFKDTLTENVKDVVEVLETFNMLKDPDVDALIKDLIVFKHINAKMLRRDDTLRTGVKMKAQATIDRLQNMMGME